jgi:hypothetical protein
MQSAILAILASIFLAILTAAPESRAQGMFDLSIINFNDLGGSIPQTVADEGIKMLGIYTSHRPYSGATPITEYNTFDLNLEASLIKLGPGFFEALRAAGSSAVSEDTAALPLFKLNIRKGISPKADMGISGIWYQGQYVVGGDFRFLLYQPEEGLNLGLRLGYTYADLPAVAYVRSLNTLNPELVLSRPLDFAEPYIGIGARYMWGMFDFPLDDVPPLLVNRRIQKKGSAYNGYLFTGVYFHIIGPQGFRMGVEGAYDFSSYHSLGFVFGLGF